MKSLIKSLSVITFVLLLSTNIKAENPVDSDKTIVYKNAFLGQIRELVQYPEFAKANNLEGFVLISFHYSSDGSLSVVEANSNNEGLKTFVIQRLTEINLCSHAKSSEKIYHMRFDFKRI